MTYKVYAISYRTDPEEGPPAYIGVYRMPGDEHWTSAKNKFGVPLRRATPAEAEADAGHRLVAQLNERLALSNRRKVDA